MSVITLDLLKASENAYLENSDKEKKIKGFVKISSKKDKNSNYSGIAYFNNETKELIITHRGTEVNKIRDIITDIGIGIGIPFVGKTESDKEAIIFTNSVLEKLKHNKPSHIYQTGHSKGGHEAQISTINLVNNQDIPVSCVTFNAPGIRGEDKDPDKIYNHLNLQTSNKIYSDLVSGFGGPPLGKSVVIDKHQTDEGEFVDANDLYEESESSMRF